MNVLEIAKREVLEEKSPEESSTVVVTNNGNFICE
jgi:hypothetical protein